MHQDEIFIASPCEADWGAMKRYGRTRYCDACKMLVHDLSSMTESEARETLRQGREGKLCVAYLHDETGQIRFEVPPGLPSEQPIEPGGLIPASRLRRANTTAAVAMTAMTVALAASGCSTRVHQAPEPKFQPSLKIGGAPPRRLPGEPWPHESKSKALDPDKCDTPLKNMDFRDDPLDGALRDRDPPTDSGGR